MTKDIKNTIKSITDLSNEELFSYETREEVLDKYFHFDFNQEYESETRRLREFTDSLELFKHFAKKWESHKFSHVCSVDRVYQYFVNPLCERYANQFIKK